MKIRLTPYLGLLIVALLLIGSAPEATVQAQEEPSTLYLPSLSTADVLRTGAQSEGPPAEPTPVDEPGCTSNTLDEALLCRGYSFPPGITRVEDLPLCNIPTPEEAMAFEEAQRERIAENGGSDPLDALNDRIISCRYDESQAQPMPGPLGDPLDYLAQPQNDQSDEPQGSSNGGAFDVAVTADTFAWMQYDMYNKNFDEIQANWIYAEASLNSGQSWGDYDHFIRISAGSATQTATCGGLAKLIAGVLKGRPGDTWSLQANTPELIFFNQGISACGFIQSGRFASTGEHLTFDVFRSSSTQWSMVARIDNTNVVNGPYTTGWTNNNANRIFAGNEIFAEDGKSVNAIHQTTPSTGYSIVVDPVGDSGSTWSDFDLPSGYTGITMLTANSPWVYSSPIANVLGNYYGELRSSLP